MQYQVEHITDISQSQSLLTALFTYIAENGEGQLRSQWQDFFRIWADQDPIVKIKVFTAREGEEIKGCVLALVVNNPLIITRPTISRIINLTNNDKAFDEYVEVVLKSL